MSSKCKVLFKISFYIEAHNAVVQSCNQWQDPYQLKQLCDSGKWTAKDLPEEPAITAQSTAAEKEGLTRKGKGQS